MPERVDMSCFDEYLDKSPVEQDHPSYRIISRCMNVSQSALKLPDNSSNELRCLSSRKAVNLKRIRPQKRQSIPKGFEYISTQPSNCDDIGTSDNVCEIPGDSAVDYDDDQKRSKTNEPTSSKLSPNETLKVASPTQKKFALPEESQMCAAILNAQSGGESQTCVVPEAIGDFRLGSNEQCLKLIKDLLEAESRKYLRDEALVKEYLRKTTNFIDI